jgi:hypothetical protein
MSLPSKPIPITNTEQLVVREGSLRGKPHVYLNVMADDVLRGHRRTEKGFSFPLVMLPVVIDVLQTFCTGPERTGKR